MKIFQNERIKRFIIKKFTLQDCHLLISLAATYSRASVLDFSNPTVYVPVSYLIPKPDLSVNIGSITKSFQNAVILKICKKNFKYSNVFFFKVWVALLISMICVILAFNLLRRYFKISYTFENMRHEEKQEKRDVNFYVLGVILSQGLQLLA